MLLNRVAVLEDKTIILESRIAALEYDQLFNLINNLHYIDSSETNENLLCIKKTLLEKLISAKERIGVTRYNVLLAKLEFF